MVAQPPQRAPQLQLLGHLLPPPLGHLRHDLTGVLQEALRVMVMYPGWRRGACRGNACQPEKSYVGGSKQRTMLVFRRSVPSSALSARYRRIMPGPPAAPGAPGAPLPLLLALLTPQLIAVSGGHPLPLPGGMAVADALPAGAS